MRKLNLTNLAFILGIMVSTTFVSCEQQEQEINLRENEQQRQEAYQQILNDEELFNEFIAEMHHDPDVMRNMYRGEQVQAMMMNHPDVIDSVMIGVHAVLEEDTMMRRNPQRREQMMRNMMNMMELDTVMYREMQLRMQEDRMNNPN